MNTIDNFELVPEQVQHFRHSGYLKLAGALSEDCVGQLRKRIHDDIAAEVAPCVRNPTGEVTRISDIWGRDALFRGVLTSPLVLDPLADLIGPNIVFTRNRHNHATLRSATDSIHGSSMHCDMLYWTRGLVSVIFYLEDATVEKGCTWIVPGSHLATGFAGYRAQSNFRGDESTLFEQAVPVPMTAGQILVIDGMTMHRAGRNTTPSTRLSMTAGYHAVDELADPINPRCVVVRGQAVYQGNDDY